jgi:TRAP-type mannitol/chloroaromatic compound transport system substrate-binding protein
MGVLGRTALAGALAATFAVGGLFSASAQETITWKIQTGWLPGNALYQSVLDLSDRVAKQTNGRLKIEILPAGAVAALNQTIDMVKTGILDGHIS